MAWIVGAGLALAGEAVSKIAVEDGRLVANLHRPEGEGPFPALLLVGGSGGGIAWQDTLGALLAQDGFAALALAYFGLEGLPAELERIPRLPSVACSRRP